MNRDTFLQRVRQARAGRAYRVNGREIPPGTGYLGAGGDLAATLAAEIGAVGGEAHVVGDFEAAGRTLRELLEKYGAGSALCWRHPLLDRLEVSRLLEAIGIQRQDYETLADVAETERRESMLAADVGISSVDCAIAETGTLMVCSSPGRERVASLLPPVHVAVVEYSQIVPDLFDAIAQLEAAGFEGMPSNVALITGPSKTGDIELQLTTGVHGPGKWHVIIINKPAPRL